MLYATADDQFCERYLYKRPLAELTQKLQGDQNVYQELGAVKRSEQSSSVIRFFIKLLEQNWCCKLIKCYCVLKLPIQRNEFTLFNCH